MKTKLYAFGVACAVALAGMSASAQDLPRSASIGTNPQGSLFYAVSAGVASILSEAMPVNIRPRPMGGTTQFVPLMHTGELELGVNNIHDVRMAYYGIAPWKQYTGMRAIAPLIRLQSAMVVRNNGPIKVLADAKGQRITGNYSAHLISLLTTQALLANAGLRYEDFRQVPVTSHVEGIKALQEGRADIVYGAFNPALREADVAIPGGVRFLSVSKDPAAVKRMLEVLPGSGVDRLPKGHFTGILEELDVIGYDVYLTAGRNTSDELVYRVTKALWEREEQVKKAHRELNARFSRAAMIQQDVTVPYHSGAIRFFKEQGLWTPVMEAHNTRLLADQKQDR